MGAQGLPKAPQKRHRGHPEDLRNTSSAPCSNKSDHRCSKVRKMTPQGLLNQGFFKACGTPCLILSLVFWKTAYMQSAHACAVQTAFQALPTHLKIKIKHTLGTQKHKYDHVSISNAFLLQKWTPEACKSVTPNSARHGFPQTPFLFSLRSSAPQRFMHLQVP